MSSITPEQSSAQQFLEALEELTEAAKMAERHNQLLSGSKFYPNKFHKAIVKLAGIEATFIPLIKARITDPLLTEILTFVNEIKSTANTFKKKSEALKKLEILFTGTVFPSLGQRPEEPVLASESVLPIRVIKGTRGYLEKITVQANVCYEHSCFDASAVMIRKLIELLIIQVYEYKGRALDIKNVSGHYFMLGELISFLLKDTTIHLGRETAKSLPSIKELGDRSAHTRHYLSTKTDVDKVLSGLRVSVEDLLHHGGLR
jgi:hypothetical protein